MWALQVLGALLFGASGVMKALMFGKVSERGPVLLCVAAGSLEGPWHPRTRLHGRADRPRRPPLAAGANGGGRRGPDQGEPRVRLGAGQVPRDRAHHLKRRAGSPHGVHRVWPDDLEADLLNASRKRSFAGLARTCRKMGWPAIHRHSN